MGISTVSISVRILARTIVRRANRPAVPDSIIAKEKKQKAFGPAVQFIKDTHLKHGFEWH